MQQLDGPATSRGGYRAGPPVDNVAPRRLILGIAIVSALIYLGLSRAGDLRASLPTLFTAQGALLLLMLGAWRAGRAGRYRRIVIGAAVAFRLIAAVGPPALSDDVQRDEQGAGHDPARPAPSGPPI